MLRYCYQSSKHYCVNNYEETGDKVKNLFDDLPHYELANDIIFWFFDENYGEVCQEEIFFFFIMT